ncbi:MAG: hypothetical protein ACPG7F_00800 [Aggregatilineales bacterium]
MMIFKQWEQVLGGSKTQTRRILKPGSAVQYLDDAGDIQVVALDSLMDDMPGLPEQVAATGRLKNGKFRTQYKAGKDYAIKHHMWSPGMWVKPCGDGTYLSSAVYEVAGVPVLDYAKNRYGKNWERALRDEGFCKARHTIDAIRLERLRDISAEDALAEGLILQWAVHPEPEPGYYSPRWWHSGHQSAYDFWDYEDPARGAVSGYRLLWDHINGKTKYRWVNNPVVAVFEIGWRMM